MKDLLSNIIRYSIITHNLKKWEYFLNNNQWKAFSEFRTAFKQKILEWNALVPDLRDLQKKAAELAKTPEYPFENPIVYNRALDEVQKANDIKLIVIGDNPGKNEQLTCNCRYLVGQAGKIAEGWFKKNPEFNIDFRKNVIILNKTPIHSAKTSQLNIISRLGGKEISDLIEQSQIWMAEHTAKLHMELYDNSLPELWLVGYAELKGKGIFTKYKEKLFNTYTKSDSQAMAANNAWNSVYVFQHFSMNRFTIDFNDFLKNKITSQNSTSADLRKNPAELWNELHKLGEFHKSEIFS